MREFTLIKSLAWVQCGHITRQHNNTRSVGCTCQGHNPHIITTIVRVTTVVRVFSRNRISSSTPLLSPPARGQSPCVFFTFFSDSALEGIYLPLAALLIALAGLAPELKYSLSEKETNCAGFQVINTNNVLKNTFGDIQLACRHK